MEVIGFDTDGYNDAFIGNTMIAVSITASANFSVSKLIVRGTGTANCSMGIYSDIGGNPGNLLGETGQVSMVMGLNTYTLATPVDLFSGSTYWIAFITSATGVAVNTTVTTRGTKYFTTTYTANLPASPGGWLEGVACEVKVAGLQCN